MYRYTDIYIDRYDYVADVSFRQISANIYWQYLLIKVLRCCSAWSVRKPKLLLRLWPWWLTKMLCPVLSTQSLHAYRPLCNIPDKMLYGVTFAHRFWRGKQMIACEQTMLRAFVFVGCFTKVSLGQDFSTHFHPWTTMPFQITLWTPDKNKRQIKGIFSELHLKCKKQNCL